MCRISNLCPQADQKPAQREGKGWGQLSRRGGAREDGQAGVWATAQAGWRDDGRVDTQKGEEAGRQSMGPGDTGRWGYKWGRKKWGHG